MIVETIYRNPETETEQFIDQEVTAEANDFTLLVAHLRDPNNNHYYDCPPTDEDTDHCQCLDNFRNNISEIKQENYILVTQLGGPHVEINLEKNIAEGWVPGGRAIANINPEDAAYIKAIIFNS